MSTLHVLLEVAGAHYALPADQVLHMEAFEGATRVPGTAPYVVGLMQSRRKVVPVVSLRARFGLPEVPPDLAARVAVVQQGARTVGLLADSAREVAHIAQDSFRPPPEMVAEQAAGFVKAVAQVKERLVMLIDIDKVVAPEAAAQQPPAPEDPSHA